MKKIVLFSLILFIGFGCNNEKPEPEPELTTIEKLTGSGTKNWHLTEAVGLAEGGIRVDLVLNRPCLKDNLLVLRSDGSYTLEDTGEVCSDVTTVNDHWTLTEDPLQIKLGSITLLERTFENVILEVTDLNKDYFEGVIRNLPENPFNATGVEMRFDAEK